MKAAIYCRLSEEDRNKQFESEDSNSIQNQKSLLLQYAQERSWEVFQIYSDDDYAGSDRNRPSFRRLLQDAEARKFDIILCKSQSRFTRELELVEKYLHGLFPLWGIRFIGVADNADTANKGNKKSRQINGLVNEWYLEDLSDNIRSVLISRRKSGYHIGAFALYGYQKDPAHRGRLQVDEEAAAVVREVFSLFARGYGKTAIARLLNERGVPNPTEYKRQKGMRYKGATGKSSTCWKYFSIADMLKNEIYIGNMVQGKYGSISYKSKRNRPRPKEEWYIVEGTHEPIIDRELWDSVQLLLQARTKPFAGGQIGLFSGKARCAYCGYSLRSHRAHGYSYLECPNHRVAKSACPGAFIPVKKLEQAVCEALRDFLNRYLDQEALSALLLPQSDPTQRRKALLAELEAQNRFSEECSKGLHALYLDHVRGLLCDEVFSETARRFSCDRDRAAKRAAQIQDVLCSLDRQTNNKEAQKAALARSMQFDPLPRLLIDVMIDHILVGRRASKSAEYPLEIHWNF